MHEWASDQHHLSSSGLTGRSSIPETAVVTGEAAAYWVPRFRGGRQKGAERQRPYAFFFTSLTLEKLMPSARSRV